MGIFEQGDTNQGFVFDASVIDKLIILASKINHFYRLSETTGIFQEFGTNQAFFFEYK